VEARHGAVGVEVRLSPGDHVAGLATRAQDAHLEFVGLCAVRGGADGRIKGRPVLGVDELAVPVVARGDRPGLDADDAERLVRPLRLLGAGVEAPTANAGDALRFQKLPLAPAQSILRPAVLCEQVCELEVC